jgi:uncharacterized protein (UPF0332 family)
MMENQPLLLKAQEALKSAHLLIENHCMNSAANRAYYAVFHAARAALVAARLSSPHRSWSHEAIQGGFSQLTHRRKVYAVHLLSDLKLLHDVRLLADYSVDPVSFKQARTVVKKADEFVTQVAEEIQS